jgi:hypothetical protein
MAEFGFAAPIIKGRTEAWRKAMAEIKGARSAAHKESRAKLGIKREHVTLQSTPMGDMAVVFVDAPNQGVIGAMMRSTSEFDTWFRDTVLIGVHGFDPKAPPPPPVEVMFDTKP